LVKLTTKKAAFPPVISPRSARSPFCVELVATAAGTRASAARGRARRRARLHRLKAAGDT
jgi:hypothetical protein